MASGEDKLTRVAIVSKDKCKPKRCRQECKKSCPVVRMGAPSPRLSPPVPSLNLSFRQDVH